MEIFNRPRGYTAQALLSIGPRPSGGAAGRSTGVSLNLSWTISFRDKILYIGRITGSGNRVEL